MIVVRIKGGLGNQLFQYAAAYALSKRTKQKMKLDNSFFAHQSLRGYKLDKLNTVYKDTNPILPLCVKITKNRYVNKLLRKIKISLPLKKPLYLLENKSDIMDEFFLIGCEDVYLDGYYQSERYFKEYRDELCRQFTTAYSPEQEYVDALNTIKNCTSVAVHVRRGDFLKVQHNSNPNHYLLCANYYHNAISYIEKAIDNPVFFWFSDDIDWVKENFGEQNNYVFVTMHTKNPDIDELMLMKNCKHIIAANSTFSWWASWLNENEGALHLCPAKRYGNKEMIPDEWVRIPV